MKAITPHKRFLIWLLSLMMSFFCSNILYAQTSSKEAGRPFIDNYSAKDYNAHAQNWSITQDDRGIMYFANTNSILEYDGANWRKVFTPPSGGAMRALQSGENGRIYFGMEGEPGYLQVNAQGSYEYHSLLPYIPDELSDYSDIWSIQVTDEGIYYQARERLFRMRETDDGWEMKNWEPEERFMYSFWLDETLYIHQRNVGMMKMEEDSLVRIPGGEALATDRVQVMLPLKRKEQNGIQRYLIVAFAIGMYIYDGERIEAVPTPEGLEKIIASRIYKGCVLEDGNIVLGSAGSGLAIIDPQLRLQKIVDQEAGLQDNSVYHAFSGKYPTNSLWLGLDRGISRIDYNSPTSMYNEPSGLTSNALCVHRHKGILYAGTSNSMFKLNPLTDRFEEIPGLNAQVWQIRTVGEEVFCISGDGMHAIENDQLFPIRPSVNGDFYALGITQSSLDTNRFYIGLDDGVAVMQRKGHRQWEELRKIKTLEQVWSIVENEDGSLWGGTSATGILKIHFPSGVHQLSDVNIEKFGENQGLPSGGFKVVNFNGEVYFLSKKGIFTFDENQDTFIPESKFNEISLGGDHNEYTLKKDAQNRVWANFGEEVALMIPKPEGGYTIENLPFKPLEDETFNFIYPEDNGIAWLASSAGLIRYNSIPKVDYEAPFNAYIRRLSTTEDSLLYAGGLAVAPEIRPLEYEQNQLHFKFSAPYFKQEEKTQYQSWLEGFQPHWTVWTKASEREFTNLPEGDYTFHVRARNVYGKISDEATYSFSILPPWYRTWWAYLLYALFGGLLIYGMVRIRTRQLYQQQETLEETIRERTKEIRQRVDELATVNEVSKAISGQLQIGELIQLVGDQMRTLFKADIAYLAMLDTDRETIRFPYGYGDAFPNMRLGQGLTSRVIQSGEPLLINRNLDTKSDELGIEKIGIPSASYIGVPIKEGNKVQGVLSVQSTTTENRFTEEDQRLLNTIATHVGVALHNAGLFQQTKHAKEEAEQAKVAAEEANEAKSVFLSTVSHELRTPLTSVLGFAKIINRRLEGKIFPLIQTDDPKVKRSIKQVKENLEVVVSEGERLTGLINDVLDLAKIEAGKFEWNMQKLQAANVIERALAATTSLFAEKELQLKKSIPNHLPDISGDQDRLIQVVINLISNAVKFTDEGSVSIQAKQKGKEMIVSVTDTGMGISKEDQPKVFEKFKQVGDTLTDKPKGTGLGLPICREIIEQHDGRIWVESELGKGSTFSFALPVEEQKKETNGSMKPLDLNALVTRLKDQVVHSTPKPNGHTASILVVDDDAPIRELLRQELGEVGYEIQEARNGKEALEKVRASAPDLIILDVMMPEMNGFDVAAVLKNDPDTMDIPIIILSIMKDQERGYRLGIDRYLTKPIDTDQLFQEVGSLLEQGKSQKKVMVVDQNASTAKTLAEVLQTRGYQVVETDGKELVERAISAKPDIIILNSLLSDKQSIIKSLRFEKGLEHVLFLVYQ